jgi:hypothetical protein
MKHTGLEENLSFDFSPRNAPTFTSGVPSFSPRQTISQVSRVSLPKSIIAADVPIRTGTGRLAQPPAGHLAMRFRVPMAGLEPARAV